MTAEHLDGPVVACSLMAAFRNEQHLRWQVGEYSFDTFMIRSRSKA